MRLPGAGMLDMRCRADVFDVCGADVLRSAASAGAFLRLLLI